MNKKWNQLFSGKFFNGKRKLTNMYFLKLFSFTKQQELNWTFLLKQPRSHHRSIWSNQATTLEHWVSEEANQIRRSLTSMICFLSGPAEPGGGGTTSWLPYPSTPLTALQIYAVELQWKCIKKTAILKNYSFLLLTYVQCIFYKLKIVILTLFSCYKFSLFLKIQQKNCKN